jgi:hypothetical protein
MSAPTCEEKLLMQTVITDQPYSRFTFVSLKINRNIIALCIPAVYHDCKEVVCRTKRPDKNQNHDIREMKGKRKTSRGNSPVHTFRMTDMQQR